MAKRDKREAGKTFLEEILAKIPEDKRAGVREVLLTDGIADFAGEQHLRHDDYSRMADDLKKQTNDVTVYRGQLDTWKGQLTNWYETKKQEVEAAATRTRELGFEEHAADLTGYVKVEDYNRAIAETQEQGLALMSVMTNLGMRHYDQFKEVLDPSTVVAHARAHNLRLDVAYDDMVRPRLEERAKKERDEEIARAREEGAIEERKRQFATPYPVGNNAPTTLDGLKPDFKKVDPVQAAVADYYEAQRTKAG